MPKIIDSNDLWRVGAGILLVLYHRVVMLIVFAMPRRSLFLCVEGWGRACT